MSTTSDATPLRVLCIVAPPSAARAIEMPVNSSVGFFTAFWASIGGFALIWHIWWIAILCLIGAFAGFVVFAWRDVHEFEVPAEVVAKVDRARRELSGWTDEGLGRAIRALAEADTEVKGGGRDPVYAVERAVLTIATSRAG